MMSKPRYVVRVLGIPPSFTKSTFEIELTKQNFVYKKVFFATNTSDGVSAGFAFVEFFNEDDMNAFMVSCPLTQDGVDVLWSSKADKI